MLKKYKCKQKIMKIIFVKKIKNNLKLKVVSPFLFSIFWVYNLKYIFTNILKNNSTLCIYIQISHSKNTKKES